MSVIAVAGVILALGGCAWAPRDEQVLTVEEYRTLEQRWAEERERRLEALLDERFETVREQGERLQALEQRSEGILVGLRELEAAQRQANRESDRDDEADASGGADDAPDAGESDGEARDSVDATDDSDDGELDLARDPGGAATGEPLVFGSQECIALPEQNLVLRARIDSGANTASLGAIDIEEFERDGDRWVRFRIPYKGLGEDGLDGVDSEDGDDDEDVFNEVMEVIEDGGETENEEEIGVRVEAEIYRRVTIIQASGEEERVVVRLPTRIGPLDQRIEYTLTDRGGMTFPVLLGRRMLRDLALVDVAREYVQPCPPRSG